MAIDFKKFAENVARRGEVEALLPIVEKELIHYDIIRALYIYVTRNHIMWRYNFRPGFGTILRIYKRKRTSSWLV